MLNFLGLGHNVDIRIVLHDEDSRKYEELKNDDGQCNRVPIYYDGETISGQVLLGLKRGSKLEHQGIRIEFVGCIEFSSDRSNRDDFVSLVQDLARPGILSQPTAYPFEFTNVSKPYETYRGTHVRLRYILRVTIQRRLTDLTKERELSVHTLAYCADPDDGIQMEVGIEDSLHIEFQYNKSKYHLHDVIVGRIYFSLVRVKIKNMEIQILKRETLGYGPNVFSDSETVAKYEIMDGAPVRGESIPLRLFLQSYPLGSTMRDVKKRFSVRYFINLVLLDEEDRRYYKQQEIILYRRSDKRPKPVFPLQKQLDQPSSPNGNIAAESLPTAEISEQPVATSDDNSNNNGIHQTGLNADNIVYPNGLQNASSNGISPRNDVNSSGSCSPDAARTSRSMCRYEPKPRDEEHMTVAASSPATLDVDIPVTADQQDTTASTHATPDDTR